MIKSSRIILFPTCLVYHLLRALLQTFQISVGGKYPLKCGLVCTINR